MQPHITETSIFDIWIFGSNKSVGLHFKVYLEKKIIHNSNISK